VSFEASKPGCQDARMPAHSVLQVSRMQPMDKSILLPVLDYLLSDSPPESEYSFKHCHVLNVMLIVVMASKHCSDITNKGVAKFTVLLFSVKSSTFL
jgi:hypothetical protein